AWNKASIGRLLAAKKSFAEAITALDTSVADLEKLVEQDPNHSDVESRLALSHSFRGWALVRSGQPSRALADLRRAAELWAKEPAAQPEIRFECSRTLALLAGLGRETKSGETSAESKQSAELAIAALRAAINTGWNWPDDLQDPDFDPLRGRDDFKKVLAELEAKSGPKAKPKN